MALVFEIIDIILIAGILFYGSYFAYLYNRYLNKIRDNNHTKNRLIKELKKKGLEDSDSSDAMILKDEIVSLDEENKGIAPNNKKYKSKRDGALIFGSICTIIAFYMETVNFINSGTGLILRRLSKGSTIAYAALFCGMIMIALNNFYLRYKSIDAYEKKEKIASLAFIICVTILVFLSVVLFVNLLFAAIAFMFSIEM